MEYIDISPIISENTAVFPGDRPFRRKISMDFRDDDHLLLSSIQTTVHIGAHADAPSHYHATGCDIATRELHFYLGSCQVIRVRPSSGERILPEDIEGVDIRAPRVLFRTESFPDPDRWEPDFFSLSPELIHFLADRGAILIGIDTPSIDPEQSKDLESHQAVFSRNLAILEGLVLEKVPAGIYTLVALPLKIKGADASPVRAILLPKK